MITAVDNGIQGPNLQSAEGNDKARLIKFQKACEQFEALFIRYMLKTMRESVDKSSLFGDGMGSDIFMSMFEEGVADKMAEAGPFGVGNLLYESYQNMIDGTTEKAPVIKDGELMPINQDKIRFQSLKPKQSLSKSTLKFKELESAIIDSARENKIDPELIKAVIMRESGGDPNAVSAKGAKGLMQLMDGTAKMLGVSDPFDIKQNINAGAKYLSNLLKKFDGDLKKALAAYNAGPSAVMKYNGIPPYEETQNYVNNIMASVRGLLKSEMSR